MLPNNIILKPPENKFKLLCDQSHFCLPSPTIYLQTLMLRIIRHLCTTQITFSHTFPRTQGKENKKERMTRRGLPPFLPSSLPCLSLFIYCLQFFHRTHIDAEKAGCECVSESFPDEGDKVEVISRALMQYDSP